MTKKDDASSVDRVIEIVHKQIEAHLELIDEQKELWRHDIQEFCNMALAGATFDECCDGIFRTRQECKAMGLDRLHPIYVMRMNSLVSAEIYRGAIEEKDFNRQKLIAERRMGWAEKKQLEHKNAQDDFAKQFSGLLDDEE